MCSKKEKWILEAETAEDLQIFSLEDLRAELLRRDITAGAIPKTKGDIVEFVLKNNEEIKKKNEEKKGNVNNPPVQVVVNMIPDLSSNIGKFSGDKGDSLTFFIKEVEHYATLSSWSDATKVAIANKHLEGLALNWYFSEGRHISEWEAWTQSLQAYLKDDLSHVKWLEMMKDRVQGSDETLTAYISNKSGWINKTKRNFEVSLGEEVDLIVDGIRDQSLRRVFLSQNFESIGALLLAGRKYDRDNNINKPRELKEYKSKREVSFKDRLEDNRDKFKNKSEPITDVKNDPKWNRNMPIEEAVCYKCQRKGHLARDCGKGKPKTFNSANERKERKDDKLIQVIMHTKEPGLGLPIIETELTEFNKCVDTLIDSGAQISVLSEKVIPLDVLIKPLNSNIRLVGLNSESKPIGMINLEVKIGPIVATLPNVPVIRNCRFDLILGADWRSQSNVSVTTLCNGDVQINQTEKTDEKTFNVGFCVLADNTEDLTNTLQTTNFNNGITSKDIMQTNENEPRYDMSIGTQRENMSGDLLRKIKEAVEKCDPTVNDEQRMLFENILIKYSDVFTTKENDLGFCDYIEHRIRLKDDTPVRFKPYRFTEWEKNFIEDKCREWEAKGIIRQSHSEYASPAFVIDQPNHPSTPKRLVVNYRALNAKIICEQSTMPIIEDEISLMTRKSPTIFSCADVKTAFLHVPIHEEDRHKTAFVTHNQLWECNRMMFGLCNAPQTMQRIMNDTYKKINDTAVYMDDLGFGAREVSEMIGKIEQVLSASYERGLRFDLAQCQFLRAEIEFLGYLIDSEGKKPHPKRIEAIDRFKKFECVRDVRSFLGFANHYRAYIPNFSKIVRPLISLLKQDSKFDWQDIHDEIVSKLKKQLINTIKLGHFDRNAETYVTVDASYQGLGAVLTQVQAGKEVTIMFASRSLSEREGKMHSNDLEMMAVHWAVTLKFRVYLYGLEKHFIVLTDNWTVTCLMDRHLINRKFARWIIDLQEFKFQVKHKPGKLNQVADGLSRCVNFIVRESDRFAYVILKASGDKLFESQAEDDFCEHIMSTIESSENFEIQDGVLTKVVEIKNKKYNRIVVPKVLRNSLLRQYHDDEGHMNAERTTGKIAKNYWWPKMYKEIYDYVSSCDTCQKNNPRTTKQYGLLQKWSIPSQPHEVISMDHIGPLKSICGYTHILIAIDHATRYLHAKAQRNPTSTQTISFLREEIIYKHRTPLKIISDNAKPFVSSKMSEFLQLHKIERVNTPPYWAESNGLVERAVGTVTRALRKTMEKETQWKEKLPEVIYALNTTVHVSLKMTPYELIYRNRPISKTDVEIGYLEEENFNIEEINHESEKQTEARKNLTESQKKSKVQYDKGKRDHNFNLGDLVLLQKETTGRKFDNPYTGPYRITKRVSENIFEIEPMNDLLRPRRIVPAQRLKKYFLRKNSAGNVLAHEQKAETEEKSVDKQVPLRRSQRKANVRFQV